MDISIPEQKYYQRWRQHRAKKCLYTATHLQFYTVYTVKIVCIASTIHTIDTIYTIPTCTCGDKKNLTLDKREKA